MSEQGYLANQSLSKERRTSSEEGNSSHKRRRHSSQKESPSSSSHSKRHKRRHKDRSEVKNHTRDGHRKRKTRRSMSHSKARKRRSQSLERRRKYRQSYSKDSDSATHSHTRNGRYNSFDDNPTGNYNFVVQNRRSRSPVSHYEKKLTNKPYEERNYNPVPRKSRGYFALKNEVKDLLRIEHHHVVYEGKEDSNGGIPLDVEWCFKYLDPSIRGHITGGRAILHHRCRQCNRICLHLLGKYGTGKRMCLACAAWERGWLEEEVPSWYFHKPGQCHHCRPRQGYHN